MGTEITRGSVRIDLKELEPRKLAEVLMAIDRFVEASGVNEVQAPFVNALEWALREKILYQRGGRLVVNGNKNRK